MNYFTEPTCQDEFIREFRENSNPVEIFVHECAEEFSGTLTRKAIYNRYKDWCTENGHLPRAANRFHSAFRAAMGDSILFDGQKRINGTRQWVYEFSDGVSTKWENPYPIDFEFPDQLKM